MTAKATRHPKTPAQRAQEQVDVLTRRLAKIKAAYDALQKQARDLAPELDAVQARLTYALANPDLPKITDAKPPSERGA
jgi:cell division protein FtsB